MSPEPEDEQADLPPNKSPVQENEQAGFPILDLPAELRIHIYRMALVRNVPLDLSLPCAKHDSNGNNESGETTLSLKRGPQCSAEGGGWLYTPSSAEDYDPITPALLLTCQQIYREARQVLYSDNRFIMNVVDGVQTLSHLHQRSRSLIRDVTLEIPTHHDILDGFADLVRLGLRYCWGLKRFTIVVPHYLPDDQYLVGATSVYANAFHILRWLPKTCEVRLRGNVSERIRRVVDEEGRYQHRLDEVCWDCSVDPDGSFSWFILTAKGKAFYQTF
jgi:hypothetical protein